MSNDTLRPLKCDICPLPFNGVHGVRLFCTLCHDRVIQASQESHQILEEHTRVGSSSDSHVDATIVKLHRRVVMVCHCGAEFFWDFGLQEPGLPELPEHLERIEF